MSIEDRLVESLRNQAARIEPKTWNVNHVLAHYQRHHQRQLFGRALLVAASASLALALGLTLHTLLPLAGNQESRESSNPAATAVTPTAHQVLRLKIGDIGGAVNASSGVVWVSAPSQHVGRSDQLVEVDAATGSIVSTMNLPSPAVDVGVGVGDVGVWVTTCPDAGCRLIALSTLGQELAAVPGTGPYLVVDESAAWTVSEDGRRLLRVSNAGGLVSDVDLGLPPDDRVQSDLVVIGGRVWGLAAQSREASSSVLFAVDRSDGTIADRQNVSADPTSLIADGDNLWLTSGTGAIRVSAATGTVIETIPVPDGFSPIGALDGRVWFLGTGDSSGFPIASLDESTGAVESAVVLTVPPALRFPVSASLDVTRNEIWVSQFDGGLTELTLG